MGLPCQLPILFDIFAKFSFNMTDFIPVCMDGELYGLQAGGI